MRSLVQSQSPRLPERACVWLSRALARNVWFTGPPGSEWRSPGAFDRAWLHHQHRNPHHWQHWLLREDDGDLKVLRMPHKLVREMVADWMGAGRAITGRWDVATWYEANAEKIQLHPEARVQVENLIANHVSPLATSGGAP